MTTMPDPTTTITARVVCMDCGRLVRTEQWKMRVWRSQVLKATSHGLCPECAEKRRAINDA
jgi:DNA-directed RNA polymerase subunit RPC12/RpoP